MFDSVPSIKQDSARKHSQLGCHLNGSQAQHSWRCPHGLLPRLKKTGHSFRLPEATLQLSSTETPSIECLLMHQAGQHKPPHWKGRAVQAPHLALLSIILPDPRQTSTPLSTSRHQKQDYSPRRSQSLGCPEVPLEQPEAFALPSQIFSTPPITFFVPPCSGGWLCSLCHGARTVDYLPPSLCPVGLWQSWGRRR